jgi:tricorn protease
MIAWTSNRDGPAEVYLADIDGGQGRRLTYWGDRWTLTCGWTPEGEVLAISAHGQPFRAMTWAYAVAASGGDEAAAGGAVRGPLPFGPVGDVVVEADRSALLTASAGRLRDPAFWKRYRGGRAGRLWVGPARAADGQPPGAQFTRILADLAGQFSSPMLVGGRLAFLSDHEGTGNLYSCALDGSDLRRHTDHDGFYARNASTDGNRVVYHCAGDIWLLDGLDAARPAPLEITLSSPAAGRAPRLVSADDHLGGLSCDQSGQASAIEIRGTVHWLTHRDGPAPALSAAPGVRARLPRVLGRSGQVVWVTDADGADALEVGSAGDAGAPPRRLASGALGNVASLAAAPDGQSVAVAAHDGSLRVVDVDSGSVTELTASDNGEVTGLAWSPDSAWLAWSHPGPEPLRRVRMVRMTRPADPDRMLIDVTDGRFRDTDPVFTGDGRYLALLSRRSFDPVYDAHFFDLSFPYGSRPYLIPLAAATPPPFAPIAGGRPVGDGKTAADANHGGPAAGDAAARGSGKAVSNGAAAEPPVVTVDPAGLAGRVVQVPVAESRYSSLRAVAGGLAWLKEPLAGNLGEGRARGDDRPRPALERFDFEQQRCTELADEVDWFEVSGDGTRLVVRDHGSVSVRRADRKPDPDSPTDNLAVDLSRARFLADPAGQWRNAYAEAGRLMRHDFWVPDMADVDWDAILESYRPLLDRISSSDEFADLLWEVFGELGSSHAYVVPAPGDKDEDGDAAKRTAVGLLGADLSRRADGSWQVARVVPGESSDPRARSPLAAPGAEIGPGDTLVAVDGRRLDGAFGPGPLLVGVADKPVELAVIPAAGGEPRRAVVVPLADELRLRYQDWVAGRRRRVRELSDGKIGYLHVPDMMSEGWADFHRDLHGEIVRDALIVDVRSNSGGHTSELVIEKLARKVIGWDVPRGLQATTYPQDAPRGPVVALADEFAGSDGDMVTAAIKILGLGPVVGARTWGGLIGFDDFHELVEGTRISIPRYPGWLVGYGWGVENHGVDPDIEVIRTPADYVADADPQLDTAVRLALEALQSRPAAKAPGTADRPSRRRPPLPPR